MPSLLDLCEKYFQSRDLYEVLKIPNTANQKQGKRHSTNLLPNLFLPSGALTQRAFGGCQSCRDIVCIRIYFSVRKAYHKLSLLVHPDRVEEKEKIEATEKFKVLGKIHSILSDKEKRAIYDESGKCL